MTKEKNLIYNNLWHYVFYVTQLILFDSDIKRFWILRI